MCLRGEKQSCRDQKCDAEEPLNSKKMTRARSGHESKRLFQQPLKPCPFKACCLLLTKQMNNPERFRNRYPVCTGSAALQRRVRRGQTSALAVFFLPLLRGPKGPRYPHGRIHQLWNRSKNTRNKLELLGRRLGIERIFPVVRPTPNRQGGAWCNEEQTAGV